MTKKWPGPSPGVRLIEVSVKRGLTREKMVSWLTVVFFSLLNFYFFFTGGESFNPTFPEVSLVSMKLVTFIPNDLFLYIVVYQSLQQTNAVPCGALDVLMFANDSR